jgi:DNA-directed RNA polymerase sigma subunit (sigma70/sigma32)
LVIASITINDQVHKFSTYDFWMIPAHIKEELQNLMKKDLVRAQVELVAKMYVQRFPYEPQFQEKNTQSSTK